MGSNKTMRMASMRESRDSDRFLVNTQVRSRALLRRGFGTSVPFIITETTKPHAACVRNLGARARKTDPGLNSPESVCVSVTQHLTFRVIIRATNDTNLLSGG